MFSEEQVDAYLKRLGMQIAKPTREYLDELVFAHQKSIPFETVGLHRSDATPNIDCEAVFNKAITQKRGGYCFELNTLFEELLRTLGFDVRPSLCRAVRGREGRMPINHKGLIVNIEGIDYFVDVGFGGPMPSASVCLEIEGDQSIRGETYFVVGCENGWMQIQRITKGSGDLHDDGSPATRQTELELCTVEVEDIDFHALNLACSQPGTLFRDHELVNLRTDGGHLAYRDGVLTVRENGSKHVEEFNDPNAIDDMLIERFGIDYRKELAGL